MELNEFITNVLTEVVLGVKNANKTLSPDGSGAPFEIEAYRRDNERGFINFDIAVKTTEGTIKGGKAGIEVLNIGIGGKAEKNSSSEISNRIKFSILPNRNIS
jgi:hypothetical protein